MGSAPEESVLQPMSLQSERTTLPIPKNLKYHWTLWRDTWRYRFRRIVHQFQRCQEICFRVPRWKQPLSNAPRPRLSVCIITMNAEHRLPFLLAYLKAHLIPSYDELVIGVDSKTTDNTLAVCREWATTVFIIENPHLTCNSGLEALVSRCSGDWILRLDDDEFPEPHFFQLLPGLLASAQSESQAITHFKLPRLHLCEALYANESLPAKLKWVNDGYLYPDYQMRLFKNDPALLSFPGAVGHTSVTCGGRRGKVHSVNLVHLNLAMNSRAKRVEKLTKYIQRLNGGWVHPVNERALLFEDFHYAIESYTYPEPSFGQTLAKTILTQQNLEAAVNRSMLTVQ